MLLLFKIVNLRRKTRELNHEQQYSHAIQLTILISFYVVLLATKYLLMVLLLTLKISNGFVYLHLNAAEMWIYYVKLNFKKLITDI